MTELPVPLPVNPSPIPPTLKSIPNWLCWRYELRDDKPNKTPVCAVTGRNAATNNPSTWCDFDRAFASYQRNGYAGVGFVLDPSPVAASSGIVGVDLDHCRDEAGNLTEFAAGVVADLDSYTEWSPSGTGLRVFVRGTLPASGRQKDAKTGIEMYDGRKGRYLTLTGNVLSGREVMDRPGELTAVYARTLGVLSVARETRDAREGNVGPIVALSLTDTELLAKIFDSAQGAKARALYERGDLSEYGGDHSAADLALVAVLAFWCQNDPAWIDRIFRGSALFRDKWDRDDYRDRTINTVISGNRQSWDPTYQSGDPKYTRGVEAQLGMQNSSGSTEWTDEDLAAARKERQQIKKEENKIARRSGIKEYALKSDELTPVFTTNQHLRHITAAAFGILLQANNPPVVFKRAGRLAQVIIDEDQPITEVLGPDELRHRLSEISNFVATGDEGKVVPIAPPTIVVNDLMAKRQWPGIPSLYGMVTAPVVSAEGHLERVPGYLPSSKLFYYDPDPRPIDLLAPTDQNVAAAVSLLLDTLLGDFPFANKASRANALALILQPFVRPVIEDCTPMYLIDAPTRGTGKSLLAETVSGIFTPGGATPTVGDIKDNEEWRKNLTTGFLSAQPFLWFDNIRNRLDAGALCVALTAKWWRDRLLGVNAEARLAVRCVWIGTGNNVRVSEEIARRICHIQIDANIETPGERYNFKIPNLRGYVKQNRPLLLGAVLTILTAWLQAGRPLSNGRPLASFEEWYRVMGGILETAGVEGFMDNRDVIIQRGNDDSERARWIALFDVWFGTFGSLPTPVKDLYEWAKTEEICAGKEGNEVNERKQLSKALTAKVGNVLGCYRVEKGGAKDNSLAFVLLKVEDRADQQTAAPVSDPSTPYGAADSPEDEPKSGQWWDQ